MLGSVIVIVVFEDINDNVLWLFVNCIGVVWEN